MAREAGNSAASGDQLAIRRPSVATIIIGARNEAQLRDNIGAVGWSPDAAQVNSWMMPVPARLSSGYWHQQGFAERNLPLRRLRGHGGASTFRIRLSIA